MNMLSKAQGNAVDTHVQSEETPGKKGKVNKNDIIDGKAITFDSNGKVMLINRLTKSLRLVLAKMLLSSLKTTSRACPKAGIG